MSTACFIITAAISFLIMTVLAGIEPQRIAKKYKILTNAERREAIKRLRALRRLCLEGEIMLIPAFYFLYSRLDHGILFPGAIISASCVVGFRYMLANVVETIESFCEYSDSQHEYKEEEKDQAESRKHPSAS